MKNKIKHKERFETYFDRNSRKRIETQLFYLSIGLLTFLIIYLLDIIL